MTRQTPPEGSHQCQQRGDDREKAPLQPSRRAYTDQLSHQQSEIEATGVNQQALQNVRVPAQVDAPHPTCFVEMGERPFQALTTEPQQS